MRRFLCILAIVLFAGFSRTTATTRYAAMMSTQGGRDTLNTLALWEDQRVTGDGALFAYLSSSNPVVRARAVQVIGRIQDPSDVVHLIPMLKDRDPRVVEETIFALGQIGEEEAVAPLLDYAKQAPDVMTPLLAEAMGKIGGSAAVEYLLELLRDFSGAIRAEAALALARADDETAGNSLLIAIHDPDPEVAWRAIYALEKADLDRVGKQIAEFLDSDDARVRAYAARTLGKQKYKDAVPQLCKHLNDADRHVVVNAARALGEIGDKKAVDPLGELATESEFRQLRRVAVVALGRIGDKGGKDYLIKCLLDTSSGVRGEAIRGLAGILGDDVAVFAEPMREDGTRHVRAAALESLGEGKAKESLGTLMKFADHKDPWMRAAAIGALGKIEDDRVGPFLVTKLGDPDWVVATTAVSAIGEAKFEAAIPNLIDTYRTRTGRQEVDIRLEVLRVLEKMKTPAAEDLARHAIEDSDPRVREIAARILSQMGVDATPPSDRDIYKSMFDRGRFSKLSPPLGLRHAVIETPYGEIQMELFGDDATQTVASFIKLAESGFYDGLTFHRVVPNFVVQGGDPRGDGWGDAGYNIRSEFNRYRYGPGFVGMAHAGKDTGGCQFFITYSPQHHLDGRYTIFGRVTKGLGLLWQIDQGDKFKVRMTD